MSDLKKSDFTVGMQCIVNKHNGDVVTVVEWDLFYEHFHDQIDYDSGWYKYVPIRDSNGEINGYYPEYLTPISNGDAGYIESVDNDRKVIEI